MSPLKLRKPQIKTGSPINLMQLIWAVLIVLAGAFGMYVDSRVSNATEKKDMQDRIKVLEDYKAKNEANIVIRAASRKLEENKRDDKIAQNTQDIELLKVTKKDK